MLKRTKDSRTIGEWACAFVLGPDCSFEAPRVLVIWSTFSSITGRGLNPN